MIFIALLFFIILIVVHEYGHFLAAKRNGVEVEEFGIGFPPKVAGKTFGKGIFRSYYTLNLLPLGGFVRLKGESDADKVEGGFGRASFWVKTKIILAGVTMNFLIAWIIFTGLALTSIPSIVENQYSVSGGKSLRDYVAAGLVEENTPAKRAGIEVGDKIVSIDGVIIDTTQKMFDTTESLAGKTVKIAYQRGSGATQTSEVTLNTTESNLPYLGIGPAQIETNRYNIIDAPIVGAGTTLQLTKETYRGLGQLVSNLVGGEFSEAGDKVSGPVGVFVILDNASVFGFEYLLFFIGVISLTLAIMNSLPIPALDGGRLFVSGLFKLLKRPLSKQTESAIHGTGFALLMVLIVLISVIDVRRFF